MLPRTVRAAHKSQAIPKILSRNAHKVGLFVLWFKICIVLSLIRLGH